MAGKILLCALAALSLLPIASRPQSRPVSAGAASPKLRVRHVPAGLTNGAPCLFRVDAATPLRHLAGRFLGKRIFFNFDASTGTWYGFAGVDLDAAPGLHSLHLEGALLTGRRVSSAHAIAIDRASYRTSEISVASRFTEPDAAEKARIRRERAIKSEVFGRVSPNRLWTGDFVRPVDDLTTEPFGVARVFNGTTQSVHQGLDLRAAAGTPVAAMNRGRVLLARDMFYEGGLLVIDHGQGLLTLYMHLSRIDVREGDAGQRGQLVARSGETGRVTGPHLHVGIRWQGLYLDPETLFRIELP